MKQENLSVRDLVQIAIVAAIYVALTMVLTSSEFLK